MPFVGETGGVGPGEGAAVDRTGRAGPIAGPAARSRRAADRPGLAERLAEARRQADEHLDHDAPRAPRPDGCSDDDDRSRRTAGRRRGRDGPGPGPGRPRLPPPRPAARPAHPGPRRRLLRAGRPQGPGRHGAAPRRPPGCATTPPTCAPASARGRRARPARAGSTASSVALETQAAALAGEALPYLEHVDALLRATRRRAGPTPSSTRPRRGLDALLPGDGPLDARLAAWDDALRDPGRAPAGRGRLAGRALPGDGGRETFGLPDGEDLRVSLVTGPAVVRLQLVRRRPPLAGRHQHRPAGPRRRPAVDDRPRDLPGPPPRARLEGGRPGRRAAAGSSRRSCSSTRPSA